MSLKRLIKEFRLEEKIRDLITLDAGVRLNPERHFVQLEADADGLYPLTDDLAVRTWVSNPTSVKQWLIFEADVSNYSHEGSVVTSVEYRLGDGTDDYWWDGGAWDSAPAAGEWNTMEEIAANISTFPVTEKKLQVIANLKTTNANYTPIVRGFKVLYSSDVEFQEDIIYRSLVPLLRNQIRVAGRYPFVLSADSTVVDILADYPIDTPYTFREVTAVYNHTDDPDHLTNLFQSATITYDAEGNLTVFQITLTGLVASGKALWVEFLWEPEVAVTTSQDYSEIDKVPCVILDDINLVDSSEAGSINWIVNRSDGTAVKIHPPIRGHLDILLYGVTDKGIDQMRLADALKSFFSNNPQLTAVGTDEEYDLWLMDEYDMSTPANRGDIHTGKMRFQIKEVLFFVRDPEDIYGVENFYLQGDMDSVLPS